MNDEYKIVVDNATLRWKVGDKLILRSSEHLSHGDFKVKRDPLPPGKYEVYRFWENFYGFWIRIHYNGEYYDIKPGRFTWHKEDQV